MANIALDEVRKGIKPTLSKNLKSTLKYDRKLLLARKHDLQPMEAMVVETWCNAIPELRLAYLLKEGFYDIWESKDSKEAVMMYNAWKFCIPDAQASVWKPITTAVANWQREIFSYFDLGKKITNAFTESNNRRIRDRHRDARGLSFDVCRAKILFAQQHKVSYRKPQKTSPFSGRVDDAILDRLAFVTGDCPQNYTLNDSCQAGIFDYGIPISTVMAMLESGELD